MYKILAPLEPVSRRTSQPGYQPGWLEDKPILREGVLTPGVVEEGCAVLPAFLDSPSSASPLTFLGSRRLPSSTTSTISSVLRILEGYRTRTWISRVVIITLCLWVAEFHFNCCCCCACGRFSYIKRGRHYSPSI
ncbi:hypothetical protein H9L39_07387 [Fusarium oxysporum f. sp. albedinis]|nr:hypothetical protein H9L39_07387 [Fusarium oxysporum f. sp. albedinis]